MILRALLIWCVLLVVAIINDSIREGWIVPELGQRLGHVVTLSVAILAVSWVTIRLAGARTMERSLSDRRPMVWFDARLRVSGRPLPVRKSMEQVAG